MQKHCRVSGNKKGGVGAALPPKIKNACVAGEKGGENFCGKAAKKRKRDFSPLCRAEISAFFIK
jgi:hypothetical protein